MKKKQGLLFVVSAPSGAGKTTLCRAVSSESMDNATHSISITTRKPRPGEIDGRDYHFVSKERFAAMIAAGDFAEWAEVHGNRYGTSRRVLDDMLARGLDIILDIDTQGAAQIRKKYAAAVYIFIMPPSIEILEERLRNRKSDNEEEIRIRMRRSREEIRDFRMYDYIIVNREFDRALAKLRSIMMAERSRTKFADEAWIESMTEENRVP